MRGEEVPRRAGARPASPECGQFPARVADAAPRAGRVAGEGRPRPHAGVEAQLGDVYVLIAADEDLARTGDVGPLGEELPLWREQLHAAVLAIGDVDGALPVHRDAVRQVKLPGAAARLAPR